MCDNFVTFLPCGTDQRVNGIRIKGRRETITLVDMEKERWEEMTVQLLVCGCSYVLLMVVVVLTLTGDVL
jgi:hypothetical protein